MKILVSPDRTLHGLAPVFKSLRWLLLPLLASPVLSWAGGPDPFDLALDRHDYAAAAEMAQNHWLAPQENYWSIEGILYFQPVMIGEENDTRITQEILRYDPSTDRITGRIMLPFSFAKIKVSPASVRLEVRDDWPTIELQWDAPKDRRMFPANDFDRYRWYRQSAGPASNYLDSLRPYYFILKARDPLAQPLLPHRGTDLLEMESRLAIDIERDPLQPVNRLLLGALLDKRGARGEALEVWRPILDPTEFPEMPYWVYVQTAAVFRTIGHEDLALQTWDIACDRYRELPPSRMERDYFAWVFDFHAAGLRADVLASSSIEEAVQWRRRAYDAAGPAVDAHPIVTALWTQIARKSATSSPTCWPESTSPGQALQDAPMFRAFAASDLAAATLECLKVTWVWWMFMVLLRRFPDLWPAYWRRSPFIARCASGDRGELVARIFGPDRHRLFRTLLGAAGAAALIPILLESFEVYDSAPWPDIDYEYVYAIFLAFAALCLVAAWILWDRPWRQSWRALLSCIHLRKAEAWLCVSMCAALLLAAHHGASVDDQFRDRVSQPWLFGDTFHLPVWSGAPVHSAPDAPRPARERAAAWLAAVRDTQNDPAAMHRANPVTYVDMLDLFFEPNNVGLPSTVGNLIGVQYEDELHALAGKHVSLLLASGFGIAIAALLTLLLGPGCRLVPDASPLPPPKGLSLLIHRAGLILPGRADILRGRPVRALLQVLLFAIPFCTWCVTDGSKWCSTYGPRTAQLVDSVMDSEALILPEGMIRPGDATLQRRLEDAFPGSRYLTPVLWSSLSVAALLWAASLHGYGLRRGPEDVPHAIEPGAFRPSDKWD